MPEIDGLMHDSYLFRRPGTHASRYLADLVSGHVPGAPDRYCRFSRHAPHGGLIYALSVAVLGLEVNDEPNLVLTQ